MKSCNKLGICINKTINCLFSVALSFFMSLILVKADSLPGARSATDTDGDVFLGGNYIEIGISKNGSFGTKEAAPAGFNSHALGLYSYKLGLISDGDGWDIGNAPTSGDFFLPGSPYEGYIISYSIGEVDYLYSISERTDGVWGSNAIFGPVVEDQSDLEKGILKATVTVITKENVKIEMMHQFGVNDIYYMTNVKITNLSDSIITNVQYKRDLDPDNDKDFNNTYDTYNKVICNPNKIEEGSSTNYAMVVARGPITFNGFFFVSFDNRALATIDNVIQSGLPTQATDELLAISSDNINGYSLDDDRIQLSTFFGEIESNKSDETVYYSSLDPNVINSITNILKAVSANVKRYTDTRIEIETEEGYEYSIDGGETWQESGVFDGLEPGKEYTILSRIKATDTSEASEPESLTLTTKNSGQSTPNISGLLATEDTIIVQNMENYEYSIDGGKTWQNEPIFKNLLPDTEYTIIARFVETDDVMYGTTTDPVIINTLSKTSDVLDEVDNVEINIFLDNSAPKVGINKGLLYEAVATDENIVNADNDDINIMFIINNLEIEKDEVDLLEKQLEEKESLAFAFDATIKLYINDVFVKNINEANSRITFTITIPDEYQKKDRNFLVIRKHINSNNEVVFDVLEDEDDKDDTITISSDKFSEFIVTYREPDEKTKSDDNIVDQLVITRSTDSNAKLLTNPKTVDSISTSILMLIISGINLFAIAIYYKLKNVKLN